MTFVFIPKGEYHIGQTVEVRGKKMVVESYSHTGKNVVVCTLPGATKFERIVCVCTDEEAIKGE